ncbi:MAG: hypothetical protein RSA64_02760 [Christensenellaceae bacterium]
MQTAKFLAGIYGNQYDVCTKKSRRNGGNVIKKKPSGEDVGIT